MNYAKCRQCGSNNPEPTDATREHFLFCSMACKEAKEAARLERFQNEYQTHNPWDRFSEDEKEVTRRLVKTKGAIKWDPELFKSVEEETTTGKPRKRADGEVDGRSKGVRKCGRCGETGHNARTCGRRKGPASLPQALQKPVSDLPKVGESSKAELASEEPKEALKKTPLPRSMSSRDQGRTAVRQAKKGGRKCGKCGESGHNARTCGRAADAKPSAGKTGRKNKCGKCGGMGHNARSCKG